jgi:hypothetical protein
VHATTAIHWRVVVKPAQMSMNARTTSVKTDAKTQRVRLNVTVATVTPSVQTRESVKISMSVSRLTIPCAVGKKCARTMQEATRVSALLELKKATGIV